MKIQFIKLPQKTHKSVPLVSFADKNKSIIKTTPLVYGKNQNKSVIKTTPLVFKKKQNKSLIKTLKYIESDTGKTRHFPAASQEWYNSIYTFNQNYVKSLPALDKSLATLLENYCNMWPKDKDHVINKRVFERLMNTVWKNLRGRDKYSLRQRNTIKPIKLYKKKTQKNLLSLKKVFVGKGDLKHTSKKVIVTLYTYNIQKRHLLKKMKLLLHSFFFTKIPLIRWKTWAGGKNKHKLGTTIIYVKKKGAKKDRSHKGTNKIIRVEQKEVIKYKKVFLLNRRLTLFEYLNSSYIYKKGYLADPYKFISKKNRLIKEHLLPYNFQKKVERLEKNKGSFMITSYYNNLLNFTNIKIKSVTAKLIIINNFYE